MKILLRSILLLLCALCPLARGGQPLPFAALDLGFESEPTLWRVNSGAAPDKMEVVKGDPKFVRSGERAMHITRAGKRPSGEALEGHCHTLNSVPVGRGEVYRVSVFAKGDGAVAMGAYLYKKVDGNESFHSTINFPAFEGSTNAPLKRGDDWRELVFRFDPAGLHDDAETVRYVIMASGDVYVDDVSITAVDSSGKSTSAGAPQEDQTIRPNLMTVATAKAPPKLDGVFSKNEYPTLVGGLVDNESRDLYPYDNRVGMAYDDQRLYLAIELHLPPGYQLNSQNASRDDASLIAAADAMFVMIREASSPEATAFKGPYTSVDSSGQIYDALEDIDWKAGSCTRDAKFNADWQSKSVVSKDGIWRIELSAPWSGLKLDPPKPGGKLLMSLGVKLKNRVVTWQSFSNWFDHYSAFGVLRFEPKGVRVRIDELASLARGEAKPSFHLSNESGEEKTFDLLYLIAKPRMVGGGFGAWVYDNVIDARRKEIVRGQSVMLWDKSGKLAAGKSTTQGESQKLKEPAYYVLESEARIGGEAVFYQRVPFHFVPPIRVSLSPVPSRKIVEAMLDLRGAAPEQRAGLSVELLDASGKSAHKQPVKLTGPEVTVAIPIGDIPPGNYQVVTRLRDNSGKDAAKLETPFRKPPDPEWLTNPAGIESRSADWVPIPWTPVEIKGNSVSVWARRFEFDGSSLISGIVSQDRKVLSSPATIKYIAAGKEQVIELNAAKVTGLGKGRAQVSQNGSSPSFNFEGRQTIEFDGMNLLEFTLSPVGNSSIDAMWLEIPIADAQMSVIQARMGVSSHFWQRGVPDDQTFQTPRRYDSIWLGNEQAGLCYFVRNYRGWLIDSRKPRVELKSNGDQRTLRLMLVNTPTKVSSPMKIELGLQPTPFKPVLANARNFRPNSDYVGKQINLYLTHSSAWNSTDSKPSPRNWEMFNELVTHYHKQGMRVNPYIATYQLAPWDFYRKTVPFNQRRESYPADWLWYKKDEAPVLPEYEYYQRDWETTPRLISPAEPETRELASMAAGSSYDDFFAGGVRDMLTRSDFDGFFMDISCPVLNFDESRCEVYTTLDGAREGTFEALATRDLYKRLYWLFEKHRSADRRPWMIGHNLPSSAPYSAFWDLTVNGEEIKPSRSFEFTELCAARSVTGSPMARVSPGDSDVTKDPLAWRSAFGTHFGLANIILPQYGYKPELKTRETARETLSVTFLHNQSVWPGFIAAEVIYDFWDKVEAPFGVGDAEFHGYWQNEFRTGNPAVRASYWKKPGQEDYLVAVSNWNGESATSSIEFPKSFSDIHEIIDMESGDVISLSDGKCDVVVPAHDLRVFRVQK